MRFGVPAGWAGTLAVRTAPRASHRRAPWARSRHPRAGTHRQGIRQRVPLLRSSEVDSAGTAYQASHPMSEEDSGSRIRTLPGSGSSPPWRGQQARRNEARPRGRTARRVRRRQGGLLRRRVSQAREARRLHPIRHHRPAIELIAPRARGGAGRSGGSRLREFAHFRDHGRGSLEVSKPPRSRHRVPVRAVAQLKLCPWSRGWHGRRRASVQWRADLYGAGQLNVGALGWNPDPG